MDNKDAEEMSVRYYRSGKSIWFICNKCNTIIAVLWKGYFRNIFKETQYELREFCQGCGKSLDYSPVKPIFRRFGIDITEHPPFYVWYRYGHLAKQWCPVVAGGEKC